MTDQILAPPHDRPTVVEKLLLRLYDDDNYNGATAPLTIGDSDLSVEQSDVIDIISTDKINGQLNLIVSDHLDWSDTIYHQKVLQAKLNAYLTFVESGQVLEKYPDAAGRTIVFKIVFKFEPDRGGTEFLIRAQKIIESAGFSLQSELFAGSCDN